MCDSYLAACSASFFAFLFYKDLSYVSCICLNVYAHLDNTDLYSDASFRFSCACATEWDLQTRSQRSPLNHTWSLYRTFRCFTHTRYQTSSAPATAIHPWRFLNMRPRTCLVYLLLRRTCYNILAQAASIPAYLQQNSSTDSFSVVRLSRIHPHRRYSARCIAIPMSIEKQ